jgi:hypothetical protein
MDADLLKELAQRAKTRLVNQELFRQANLEAIIDESIQIAESEPIAQPSKPIDESWMWKFIENAQAFSQEELRSLWAKILANQASGKTLKPVTLDTLKNFTKETAEDFRVVGALSTLYGYFIPDTTDFSRSGITCDQAEALVDVGVLRLAAREFWSPFIVPDVFTIGDTEWGEPGGKEDHVSIYEMTSVGRELANSIYGPWFRRIDANMPDIRRAVLNFVGCELCARYISQIILAYGYNRGQQFISFSSPVDDSRNRYHRLSEHRRISAQIEIPVGMFRGVWPWLKSTINEGFYWEDISEFFDTVEDLSYKR